jgi:hypothetical protein
MMPVAGHIASAVQLPQTPAADLHSTSEGLSYILLASAMTSTTQLQTPEGPHLLLIAQVPQHIGEPAGPVSQACPAHGHQLDSVLSRICWEQAHQL